MASMVSSITVDITVKVPNIKAKLIGVRIIAFIAKLFKINVEIDAKVGSK